MAFRRFRKQWTYKNEAGQKVTIPRNWGGELPEKVAAQADKAGVTLIEKVANKPAATFIETASKDAILAEAKRRNLSVKASATKAEIAAALQAAVAPLTKPIDELSDDELATEVEARGIVIVDNADSTAVRVALTLATEQLPA